MMAEGLGGVSVLLLLVVVVVELEVSSAQNRVSLSPGSNVSERERMGIGDPIPNYHFIISE